MVRRLLIAFATLLALLLIAAIALEVVLRTDLPRRRIARALEANLGLHVQVESVRPRWNGRTSLHGLTLTSPLSNQRLAWFPSVEADHASILELLITRQLDVERLRVSGGTVDLVQDAGGRWNVQDLVEHLASIEKENGQPPDLPGIVIESLTLRAVASDGTTVEVPEVQFTAEPIGRVAWEFRASSAGEFQVDGRVHLARPWRHRATIVVESIDRYVRLWRDDSPAPLRFSGAWHGHYESGALRGRLDLQKGVAGDIACYGVLDAELAESEVRIRPRGLIVQPSRQNLQSVRLVGGSAVFSRRELIADQLEIEAFNARGWVKGQISWPDLAGRITAAWSAHSTSPLRHDGRATITLAQPAPALRTIEAQIETTGSTPIGGWDATLELASAGESLARMRWRLTAPKLIVLNPDRQQVPLSGLSAEAYLHESALRFENVRLGDSAEITAAGAYDMQTKAWEFSLIADQWTPQGLDSGPLWLAVRATGQGLRIQVHQFDAEYKSGSISGSGSYDSDRPAPLAAEVEAGYQFSMSSSSAQPVASEAPAVTPSSPAAPQWAGTLIWSGQITGSVSPRELRATGDLWARSLIFNGQVWEDIFAPTSVAIHLSEWSLRSERFELGEGAAQVSARYGPADESMQVSLDLSGVRLEQLAHSVNPVLAMRGTLEGQFLLHLRQWELDQLRAEGTWRVTDFESGPLTFDVMHGQLVTERSMLRLDPISLSEGSGRAEGQATFNLADGESLTARLTLSDWPITIDAVDLGLSLTGQADLRSDVVARTVRGRIDLSSPVQFHGRLAGNARAAGEWTDTTLTIDALSADLLGGSLEGSATVDLKDLYKSQGRIALRNLEPAAAAPWTSHGSHFSGRVSGDLTFGPATEPRPLEPMRFDATLLSDDLRVGGVDIGDLTFTGFAGPARVLLQESHVAVADGAARAWIAISRHAQGWHAHGDIALNRLNLAMLDRALKPDQTGEPVQGRLSGTVRLLGPVGLHTWPSGRGVVQLAESDLGPSDTFGALFRAMGIRPSSPQPIGEGTMRFTLDQKTLRIDSFRYYNRGISAFGDGTVDDLSLGAQTPVNFFLIGAQRPFKELKLPLADTLDRILTGLQSHLTTLRVRGTWADKQIDSVPLQALTSTIEKLLFSPANGQE